MEVYGLEDAERDLIENLNYLVKEWSESLQRMLVKEIDSVIPIDPK